MPWLVIIVSVIVIWVASLHKIFHASSSPSKATFLRNAGGALHKRNVLLVVAHPDDESIYVGSADCMGDIRKEELYQASAILKVPLQQIKILDHPDFQDGFGKVWNFNLLARIIEEEIHTHAIDLIITFDNYGVSGHCNHCDVNRGVRICDGDKWKQRLKAFNRHEKDAPEAQALIWHICEDGALLGGRKLLHYSSQRNIEAWELVSTNILRKYSGPVDIWLSILSAMCYPNEQMHCLVNKHPHKSYVAMAKHMSQWVWFRKLFVSFSSYTYVNTLRKINM